MSGAEPERSGPKSHVSGAVSWSRKNERSGKRRSQKWALMLSGKTGASLQCSGQKQSECEHHDSRTDGRRMQMLKVGGGLDRLTKNFRQPFKVKRSVVKVTM